MIEIQPCTCGFCEARRDGLPFWRGLVHALTASALSVLFLVALVVLAANVLT